MTISLGTNIASLQAQRRLEESAGRFAKTTERLSSGLRINRASDDAAGLAISSDLNATARVFAQGIRNINDGISLLNIADSALESLSTLVTRGQELAEQGANGTYSTKQRLVLDRESKALTEEFNRIVQSTKFNGIALFADPSSTLRLQVGFGADGSIATQVGGQLAINSGTGAYTLSTSYAGNVNPVDTASGDLDGDGDVDLVFNNSGSFVVSVLLNNGNGTFKAKTDYSTSASFASSIELYDVNSDGYLDMVSTNQSIYTSVNVHLGNGNGTFKAATSFITGDTPTSIDFGDLNGDGKVDLVVSNRADSTIGLFYGNGNGTFSAQVSISSGLGVTLDEVKIADFNGDGLLDLVSTQSSNNSFGIYLNQGSGTFSKYANFALSASSTSIAVEDFNDDGILDVASSGTNGLIISLGNGNGSFKRNQAIASSASTSEMLVNDVNGDGIYDLFATENASNFFSIYVGNSDGTFKAASTISIGVRAEGIAVADFNADGVVDIAGTDQDTDDLDIYIGGSTLSVNIARTRIRTQAEARAALDTFTNVLARISLERGALGATQSRLNVAASNLQTARENYLTASSRISDADVAQESANMIRNNILQMAAAAILSSANQQSTLALSLL